MQAIDKTLMTVPVLAQAGPKGPATDAHLNVVRTCTKTSRTQAVSMDLDVPGAQGPPLQLFLHGPAHFNPFHMFSRLIGALCDVPFLMPSKHLF